MTSLLITILLAAFDPSATIRALKYEEARQGALAQVLTLNETELKRAKGTGLATAALSVASNSNIHVHDRILAIRVVSRLGGPDHMVGLAPLLSARTNPESIVLAREAALALYQAGATPLLARGIGHPDPEVRATAARSGAGGPFLCDLIKADPWPQVRASAVEGLSVRPQDSKCLLQALADSDVSVLRAAVDSAQKLAMNQALPALRRIALSKHQPRDLRGEAIYALCALGDFRIAEAVLKNHLTHGGMQALAASAVRALGRTQSRADSYNRARASKSGRVLMALARVIAMHGGQNAVGELRKLQARLNQRDRTRIDHMIRSLKPLSPLGTVIDRDAPEDED